MVLGVVFSKVCGNQGNRLANDICSPLSLFVAFKQPSAQNYLPLSSTVFRIGLCTLSKLTAECSRQDRRFGGRKNGIVDSCDAGGLVQPEAGWLAVKTRLFINPLYE